MFVTGPLDLEEAERASLFELLDAHERARAARLLDPILAQRFVVGRGRLRQILAERLALDPARLEFDYGDHDKPRLAGGAGERLEFNLSHSRDRFLLGMTGRGAIGVDLESVREGLPLVAMARRYFAPGEVRALLERSERERRECFFRIWTRKEAYLKARGVGFGLRLDRFDVPVEPFQVSHLLRDETRGGDAERWTLLDLTDSLKAPGFAAAAVIEGSVGEVGWHRLE